MLVLTRKPGQTVVIRDKTNRIVCRVTVIRGKFDNLKLGFSAPPEIKLLREELDERIETEKF